MTWRDDLRPASFRGVPFEVSGHETPAGRRLVVDVYPERDTPGVQDMGAQRGAPIRLDAFVHGSDYMPARNALIDALNRPGPGELVHPYYGRLWVQAGECSWTESVADGGMCRFALEFYERAEVERTVERVTTPAAAAAAAATAQAQAQADVDARTSAVAGLSVSVRRLTGLAIVADVEGLYLPLGRTVDQAVEDSEDLTLVCDVLRLSIATFDAAISLATRPVASLFGGAPLIAQLYWAAYQRLIALVGVRRAVEIAGATDYAAADDAEAAETRIVSAIAALEGGDSVPPAVLASLRDTRTAVVEVLTNRVETLPRLTTINVIEPTPAVVLALDLYGDPERAEEIVSRNAIANPGFCAGSLTVLAS